MSTKQQIQHSKSTISNLDIDTVYQVLKNGFITGGHLNSKFKKEISSFLDKEHISLFSSGASALTHILRVLNIKKNDEVLIPNYICDTVLRSVISAGGIPVLYDNNFKNWISSKDQIIPLINSKTKAIIVNHTFGIVFPDIKVLSEYKIPIIEDCAHALTSKIENINISKYSLCSFYSFNATKYIATGEGGAVSTNNTEFNKELNKICVDNGLSDINCSLGISQLNRIEEFIYKRKEISERYKTFLDTTSIIYNKQPSLNFRFPIFIKNSEKFLANNNVAFRKGVDKLLSEYIYSENILQNSKYVFDNTISLPIYPSLTKQEQNIIIEEIKKNLND